MVPIRDTPRPKGLLPIIGSNLSVFPLEEPKGTDLRRKMSMLLWIPKNIGKIWKQVYLADVIHTPVGGDIGFIGIIISLIQKKKLFIRHCGNWRQSVSLVDRILHILLEKIAGRMAIVMATGGGGTSPSRKNKNISWIFATTLEEDEIYQRRSYKDKIYTNKKLRLISVGRLSSGKNVENIIRALPHIIKDTENIFLDVVGDGPEMQRLINVSNRMHLNQYVKFHGNVSHEIVLDLFSKAILFIFPTKSEGFPKVLIESMANGVPIISTRVSVIPTIIENKCGVILDNSDSDTLAKVTIDLLSNKDRLIEMSKRAEAISKEYTLEKWGKTIKVQLEKSWGPLR